jgi:hypothetical protein
MSKHFGMANTKLKVFLCNKKHIPSLFRRVAALKVRAPILSTSHTKGTQFDIDVRLLRFCLFVSLCFILVFTVFACAGLPEIAASQFVYCFNNILGSKYENCGFDT